MTHIDLVIRLHQIPDGTWTRCCSLNSRKPFQEGCVIAPAWRVYTYQNPFSPVRIQSTKSFFVDFRRYRPRLILNRCKGAKKYQRRGPGRIGGCKHETQRTTFGPTVYGCAIRTGRIHNCAHVANSFFDSLFGDAIRKPCPRLSKTITLAKAVSLFRRCSWLGTSHSNSTCERVPGISTMSRGPWPKMRYAMETSPLRAYLTGLSISAPLGEISGNSSWLLSASLPQFVPANVQGNDLYNCSTFETAGRSANK